MTCEMGSQRPRSYDLLLLHHALRISSWALRRLHLKARPRAGRNRTTRRHRVLGLTVSAKLRRQVFPNHRAGEAIPATSWPTRPLSAIKWRKDGCPTPRFGAFCADDKQLERPVGIAHSLSPPAASVCEATRHTPQSLRKCTC